MERLGMMVQSEGWVVSLKNRPVSQVIWFCRMGRVKVRDSCFLPALLRAVTVRVTESASSGRKV